ncbi:ParB/RepB/Spo0J family partition protein [Phenylobacterium deserti]|nr:ParB/RepB/Spo0J family partition protein [Phenylobacterium deserti]
MTASQIPAGRRLTVPLKDLGVAPENLRAEEAADADIPRLADTVRAAGLIYPLVVRRGRRREAEPFQVLDGRRRRLALLSLVEAGAIAPDAPVECLLVEGRAAQAAAAVIPNREHAPVHPADVIAAIGKLRRAHMATGQIAAALGYEELEIKRLAALAGVHPRVLEAYRQDRLTVRQVRMLARLKDKDRQEGFAQAALDGVLHDYQLQAQVQGGRVTADDTRVPLVGLAAYQAAGGRIEADLFGELPDALLDPDLLARLWRERAEALAAGLEAEGLAVQLGDEGGYRAPEGLLHLPYVHVGGLPEAQRAVFEAARGRAEAAEAALEIAGGAAASDQALAEHLAAQLAVARAKVTDGEVAAARLAPNGATGLDVSFFWRPAPIPTEVAPDLAADDPSADAPASEDAEAPASLAAGTRAPPQPPPGPLGAGHALHDARTDLATRALACALANDPAAALTVLTAHLLRLLTAARVGRDATALTVRAEAYVGARPPIAGLDADLRRRLVARREALEASGLTPIAWTAGLGASEQLAMLAELVAVCLDLREPRTDAVRRAARAEAAEIAGLCGARFGGWTPDPAYLRLHGKAELAAMLQGLGDTDPKACGLKKDELVARVASLAAAQGWVPPELTWTSTLEASSPEATRHDPAGSEPDPASPDEATAAQDMAPLGADLPNGAAEVEAGDAADPAEPAGEGADAAALAA